MSVFSLCSCCPVYVAALQRADPPSKESAQQTTVGYWIPNSEIRVTIKAGFYITNSLFRPLVEVPTQFYSWRWSPHNIETQSKSLENRNLALRGPILKEPILRSKNVHIHRTPTHDGWSLKHRIWIKYVQPFMSLWVAPLYIHTTRQMGVQKQLLHIRGRGLL
jgi:hypothetical protein